MDMIYGDTVRCYPGIFSVPSDLLMMPASSSVLFVSSPIGLKSPIII